MARSLPRTHAPIPEGRGAVPGPLRGAEKPSMAPSCAASHKLALTRNGTRWDAPEGYRRAVGRHHFSPFGLEPLHQSRRRASSSGIRCQVGALARPWPRRLTRTPAAAKRRRAGSDHLFPSCGWSEAQDRDTRLTGSSGWSTRSATSSARSSWRPTPRASRLARRPSGFGGRSWSGWPDASAPAWRRPPPTRSKPDWRAASGPDGASAVPGQRRTPRSRAR